MTAQLDVGDTLPDVIGSLDAHRYGLAWHEQVRENGRTTFRRHLIAGERPDQNPHGVAFSQPHAVAVADIGPHVLRIVPRREMPVPVVVTLGAGVDAPRTVDLLGLRFANRIFDPQAVDEYFAERDDVKSLRDRELDQSFGQRVLKPLVRGWAIKLGSITPAAPDTMAGNRRRSSALHSDSPRTLLSHRQPEIGPLKSHKHCLCRLFLRR